MSNVSLFKKPPQDRADIFKKELADLAPHIFTCPQAIVTYRLRSQETNFWGAVLHELTGYEIADEKMKELFAANAKLDLAQYADTLGITVLKVEYITHKKADSGIYG